jgi:transcriptional regulator with XRE-family HTH domain
MADMKDNVYVRAAQRIQVVMKEKGVSQTDLAGKLGVSDSFLTKFFKYGNKISLERFDEILEALNIDLLDFSEKKTLLT